MTPGPSDYRTPCGNFGGTIDEIPLPHIRRFPNRFIRRRVSVSFYTWVGIGFGARHGYAKLEEEANPLWDSRICGWRRPWVDPEGEGRRAEREFLYSLTWETKARAWVREQMQTTFRGCVLREDLGGSRPRWYRTAQREGD